MDSFRELIPNGYYRKSDLKKLLAIQNNFVNVNKTAALWEKRRKATCVVRGILEN
jgi:hypothetical protein